MTAAPVPSIPKNNMKLEDQEVTTPKVPPMTSPVVPTSPAVPTRKVPPMSSQAGSQAMVKLKGRQVRILQASPPHQLVARTSIKLWALTKEEQDVVDEATTKPNSREVICTIGTGDSVTVKSLKSLLPGTWVNDEVINGYLKFLDLQHKTICEQTGSTKSHVFNSFFMTKHTESLVRPDKDAMELGLDYKLVKRWAKKVPGKDLFKLDKILFPINRKQCHWSLAVAFMKEKCVRYYDSMPYKEGNSPCHYYVDKIVKYLQAEFLHKHKGEGELEAPKIENFKTPKQQNGNDCGVFVCAFAEHILLNKPMEFSQEDIYRARAHIAFTLISQGQVDYYIIQYSFSLFLLLTS